MGKDLSGKELGKGICQRKDGRYCGRYVDRFGVRRSVYSDTLASLKVEYAKAIYEDHEKLNIIDDTITLNQWYEKWLSVYKYGIIKRNTKEGYIRVYRKHIQPILGNMRINDITKTQIQQIVNNLHKQGYAYETPHRIQVMLYDMFDKALNDQFIRRNPAKGVKVIRDEEKDPRVMSREEQSVFFDCCKGTFYDNLFVLCVNTGIRPGESCAIDRDSVDLKHRELRIDKTLIYQKWEGDSKKTIHIDTPKTKASVRTVPLNDNAVLAIKKQLLQKKVLEERYGLKYCEKQFKDLLFTTKFNTPVIEQTFIDAIDRIVDEINLVLDPLEQFDRITPHCFRHTFATRCLEGNMKPKVLQKILGHATLEMTMNLYTHVLKEEKDSQIELLQEQIDLLNNLDAQITERRFSEMVHKDSKIIRLGEM